MISQPAIAESANDGIIIMLWKGMDGRGRKDTAYIAQILGLRESIVANRLAKLRDAGAV